MIVFSGKISDETAKHIIKSRKRASRIIGMIVCIILLIPIIVYLSISISPWVLILMALLPPFVIFAGIQPKDSSSTFANYISIDDRDMYAKCDAFEIYKGTDQVKKVVDTGNSYLIYISNFVVSSFVCQKDLITEGTLEEFEKIFEGKIVNEDS